MGTVFSGVNDTMPTRRCTAVIRVEASGGAYRRPSSTSEEAEPKASLSSLALLLRNNCWLSTVDQKRVARIGILCFLFCSSS